MTQKAWVVGAPVSLATRSETHKAIEEFVASGTPHLIVTADASCLIMARRDPEFAEILRSASLVTADGAGVVGALRMQGHDVPERVCGVDLVVDVAGMARENGWSVFLLGAAPGVAEAAGENLAARFPGLKIAGCHDGYFRDDQAVAREIAAVKPDILLIAMGMPRQEKWFWKHRDELGVKVAMGVGGSFDVLSGRVRRAPEFFQKHGLEWLYRFCCAPKKSSRKMALLPVFAGLALLEARRLRRRPQDNTESK